MQKTVLEIRNLGVVEDTKLEFAKPLNLVYGDVCAGKTTVLNAIRWLAGGAFPDDIIRHGETDAFCQLTLKGDDIDVCLRREWYRSKKDGVVKARPISMVRNGTLVRGNVVEEIRKLVNPFLLNQNHLIDMNGVGRKAFLREVLNVDTSALDQEIKALEESAKDRRAETKQYGEIDVTPVTLVDEAALQAQKAARLQEYERTVAQTEVFNNSVRDQDALIASATQQMQSKAAAVLEKQNQVDKLVLEIARLREEVARTEAWLDENPGLTLLSDPVMPSTADIDEQLSEAKAVKVRYDFWQANLRKQALKEACAAKLADAEQALRTKREARQAMLATASENCPIKDLKFNAEGEVVFEDTAESMLSTSQLMRLSSLFTALYPKGLGLELIDRAESLGTSVFKFVALAEAEDKTFIATIVGEAPAAVPEHVGVFVVDKGVVTGEGASKTEETK